MKLFSISKDGGPKSRVWGYFLIEAKKLLSVALLHFKDGGRETYHSHAFNSISWLLHGELREEMLDGRVIVYKPSIKPIKTYRQTFHRVYSKKNSWVLTFRGPWTNTWHEFEDDKMTTLTHGRLVVK